MNNNEHFFNSIVQEFSLPPSITSAWLIENGTKSVCAQEMDDYKHLFDWVDETDIRNRMLRLTNITGRDEKSIVAIYCDSREIVEFVKKDRDFQIPTLLN